MLKWWRIKVFGIYMFALGITVEVVTKADIGHFLITTAGLIFVIGANMRTRYFKKKIKYLQRKLRNKGGDENELANDTD